MQIKHLHMTLVNITLTGCTLGFINNILSATKYRTSAAGMNLMGETDKLALYLNGSALIHSFGHASAGDLSTRVAGLPIKSKAFMAYAGWPATKKGDKE